MFNSLCAWYFIDFCLLFYHSSFFFWQQHCPFRYFGFTYPLGVSNANLLHSLHFPEDYKDWSWSVSLSYRDLKNRINIYVTSLDFQIPCMFIVWVHYYQCILQDVYTNRRNTNKQETSLKGQTNSNKYHDKEN